MVSGCTYSIGRIATNHFELDCIAHPLPPRPGERPVAAGGGCREKA